jgi:hypothetical protein
LKHELAHRFLAEFDGVIFLELFPNELGAEAIPAGLVKGAKGLLQHFGVDLVVRGLATQAVGDPFGPFASDPGAKPPDLAGA